MSKKTPFEPPRMAAGFYIEHVRPTLGADAWRQVVRPTAPEVQTIIGNFRLVHSPDDAASST